MKCATCDQQTERGTLLISASLGWSRSRRPFLLHPVSLLEGSTNKYFGRPVQIAAALCRTCKMIVACPVEHCAHDPESGYVFPQTSVRWWGGTAAFEPTFWFPLSDRDRRGGSSEILIRRPFTATRAGVACPATKCAACGWTAIQYGDAVQAQPITP